MCSLLLGLRIFLLTLEAETHESASSLVAKTACVSWSWKILYCAAFQWVKSSWLCKNAPPSSAAWQAAQLWYPHLKQIHTHLSQCTWPSKKAPRRETLLLGCYLCCWCTSCCTRPPSFTASSQTGSCPSFQSCSLLSAILIVFSHPFIDLNTKESVFFSSRPQQGTGHCIFLV